MKSLFTHRMQKAPSMAFASFPGVAAAAPGLYFFSDVGVDGSFWYNNGIALKPIAPIVLYRLLTPTTTSNGTAEELIAISSKIPNGVLAIGRVLTANFLLTKSATTESTANVLKIGTNANGITSATALSSSLSLSTTSRQLSFVQSNLIVGATSVQQGTLGGSTTPFGAITSATFAARTITNIANDLYISLTGTKTTGGIETISCPFFEVILS